MFRTKHAAPCCNHSVRFQYYITRIQYVTNLYISRTYCYLQRMLVRHTCNAQTPLSPTDIARLQLTILVLQSVPTLPTVKLVLFVWLLPVVASATQLQTASSVFHRKPACCSSCDICYCIRTCTHKPSVQTCSQYRQHSRWPLLKRTLVRHRPLVGDTNFAYPTDTEIHFKAHGALKWANTNFCVYTCHNLMTVTDLWSGSSAFGRCVRILAGNHALHSRGPMFSFLF